MCTATDSYKKMDIMQITEEMQLIREKIIKTDEVFKLISEKRKEVNKSKKNYKKLISKFVEKQKEVVNLKNRCKNGINRTEIPYEKEIKELKSQNELLQKNYDEYVNSAQQKYQSACLEIETLSKTCESLNKRIETFENKEAKTKSVKKLQDTLNEVKKKLKTSLSKYDDLETNSSKIISDLKQEFKNLEERRNETLKQLAKSRLDCDDLKKSLETNKNSPIKSKLKEEIEKLKTRLESLVIEQEIVNQSHESDISELKKQHEKEKKLLEEQLKDFKNKFNEQVNIKEKELKNKHELEMKLLADQIHELKSKNVENEIGKKYLEGELEELENNIKKEANKLKETVGTQTDYEDIYNLEDIFTEMHSFPALMSPLSSASGVNEKETLIDLEKSICSAQTFDLMQIQDSNTEEVVDVSLTVIPIEPPGVCSVAVGTDNIIPTFQDSISQTDIYTSIICEETSAKSVEASTQTSEENLSKIQVKSFEDNSLLISDNNNKNKIEFKSLQPSILIPTNNILEDIPKIVKLKSRITKKYKNNNKNRLLNTLRNSKLKLKSLLEQYINTSSKVVIVSSSILKTDLSKSKMSDYEPKPEGTNNSCYSNCQHSIRHENYCSCSCQQNMFNNRYCGQCPVYQMPWDYSHGIFYNSNNQSNYYNMKNHFKSNYKDFGLFDSSDSEEEDRNLRRVLREYKHSVIRKYKTEKYFAKYSKEKRQKNNVNLFMNNRGKSKTKMTDKGKHKKSPKSSQMVYSSDSEEECNKNKINTHSRSRQPNTTAVNMEGFSEKNKNSGSNLIIHENIHSKSKENEQEDIQNVAENLIVEETMSTEKPINIGSKEINRIPNENMGKEEETNERTLGNMDISAEEIVERKVEIKINDTQDLQRIKTPFTLSKKQQSLLRKAASLKKGSNITKKELVTPKKIYETRSKVRCNKRNTVESSEVKYKKQKLELFGSASDSDTSTADECVKLENATDINTTNKIETLMNKPTQTIPQTRNTSNDPISNVEPNSENITVYSSNVRTKTRIAYKKPERCKHSIETQMEIPECINEPTCLSNEEIIVPVSNKKVFKRPGVTKSSLSHTNEINQQNECDIIHKNVNLDPPDLEIVDYVTYNTLERPSTSMVRENLSDARETVQQIDIGLAQKLVNDFAIKKLEKGLIDSAVHYLADKDPATVARLIVNVAARDFSQEYDKSFTPPAPLLTITQQKILVLLSHLEKNNLQNIHALFLQTIEKKLFSGTRIEVVHPLTRLYVAECKLKYEIENVRMFCCNAAYYMGDLFFPLMFIVLTIWGDILPMADSSQDIPLAVAIVHVVHLKTCQKPGYNFNNLNRLLSDYYGYKRGEQTNDQVMKKLICSYSDNYTKSAYLAVVILCKNLPDSWTYNQIKNHLLPLLENCSDVEKKLLTISLIQRLITQFEKNTEQDFISDIENRLSKII